MTRKQSGTMTIDALFDDEPVTWGLRGDPFLWREMRAVLAGRPLPDSLAELHDLLERSFDALTGHEVDKAKGALKTGAYHRPGGGMSNGLVSPEFWRDTAIPLIERRFLRETNANDSN